VPSRPGESALADASLLRRAVGARQFHRVSFSSLNVPDEFGFSACPTRLVTTSNSLSSTQNQRRKKVRDDSWASLVWAGRRPGLRYFDPPYDCPCQPILFSLLRFCLVQLHCPGRFAGLSLAWAVASHQPLRRIRPDAAAVLSNLGDVRGVQSSTGKLVLRQDRPRRD